MSNTSNKSSSFEDVEKSNSVPYSEEKLVSQPVQSERSDDVPNGGTKAWLQVLGSFFLFFNTWGILNAFGTYETYYQTGILSSYSASSIAWIGSIQAFLLLFVGSVTGPLYDAGYVYHLLWAGSFLVVFGQMMLSICSTYWEIVLAQAVTMGIGAGMLFVPAVAILQTYFHTRIAAATGLAAAGGSIGGLIYPIVFYRLQPSIGFPWASRVLGFIALAGLAVSISVIRVRVLPPQRRKLVDVTAFTDLPFMLFSLGCILAFMGMYAPFYFIESYVIRHKILSEEMGFYLLAIMNGTSLFGRIFPNAGADKTGPLNMIIPCGAITGLLCLCLIATKDSSTVIALMALYGFFSGSLVSLPPTIFASLTKDRRFIGTRMGMGFAMSSIGVLVGSPIAGEILGKSGFTYVWVFGGALTLSGIASMLAARVASAGPKLTVRV